MPAHTLYGVRSSDKKGENYELRAQLNSQYSRRRKDAVKKVIANMTLGNDVSSLFADVIKNMQTEDLELKKLVYLYLSTHARTKPTLVVLAVNTFVKDSQNPDPLIRALAIRTMGMLRVERITPYIIDTLKRTVTDPHPYVRKTVALCIAKIILFQLDGAASDGLISCLKEMLNDKSPAVVANAVSALLEISSLESHRKCFSINDKILSNLLKSLGGSSEWGQIVIIKALESYNPGTCTKVAALCESIIPRIQHNNPGVGLAAIRLLLGMYNYLGDNTKLVRTIYGKIAKFLVTAMNSSPEIQFVILKNMGVILQICPDIKITSIQSFFVSYKDPLYLKFEKLNILISIADETNVSVLTAELQEYRKEVEPDFVKKSIHALGQLALKFPSAAEECLNILINASSADQEGLNQDTIVVLKDIYRKYGDKFSKYIPKIFENIGVIDRNDVIAAVIWLVGEYYGMISQSYKLLLEVTEYSESLDSAVHLQLLCTLAKLSMSGDAKIKNLFIRILDISMNKSQNPDIRTRAHMYSRLLSENTNLRESIILANKPQFQFNLDIIPKYMLNDLLKDIGSLFILSWDRIGYEPIARLKSYTHSSKYEPDALEEEENIGEIAGKVMRIVDRAGVTDLLDIGIDIQQSTNAGESPLYTQDIFGCSDVVDTGAPHDVSKGARSISPGGGVQEMMTNPSTSACFSVARSIGSNTWDVSDFTTLLDGSDSKGLKITAKIENSKMILFIANLSTRPMENFGIQFDVNSVGLVPESDIDISEPLEPGKCILTYVPVSKSDDPHPEKGTKLQIAFKNNFGIYFSVMDLPGSI